MTTPLDTPAPPPTPEDGLTAEAGADLIALLPDDSEPAKSEAPPEPKTEPLDVPEPEEPDAPPAPVYYDVKVDGVVEKVTLEEMQKGYSRQADYNRRLNKHQQERKEFEAQKATEQAAVKAARDQYAAKLDKMDATLDALDIQEPDWDRIRTETPDQFAAVHAEWSLVQDKRARLATERQRITDVQRQEFLEQRAAKVAEEGEKLRDLIPDLKDETKAPAIREALFAEGAHRGFTRDEVAQTTDARLIAILNDARLYRELLTKRDALKTTPPKDAPKAVPALQPGTRVAPQPKGRKDAQTAFSRLKESGSVHDAARVLAALDL